MQFWNHLKLCFTREEQVSAFLTATSGLKLQLFGVTYLALQVAGISVSSRGRMSWWAIKKHLWLSHPAVSVRMLTCAAYVKQSMMSSLGLWYATQCNPGHGGAVLLRTLRIHALHSCRRMVAERIGMMAVKKELYYIAKTCTEWHVREHVLSWWGWYRICHVRVRSVTIWFFGSAN